MENKLSLIGSIIFGCLCLIAFIGAICAGAGHQYILGVISGIVSFALYLDYEGHKEKKDN